MDVSYVIGTDFGTDSVRSVLTATANGKEIASAIYHYPRWKKGLYCDPASNRFRQHPLDYIEGLEATIKTCLSQAGPTIASQVKAISVDTTGSTPVAVDQSGTPLALLPAYSENPNAMFVLWKDHTATLEAMQINEHAQKFPINYLQFVGGIYSSEWFWAKLLHILREDAEIRNACYSWVEHCDWIPFLLTGGKDISQMKRSVCAAGHKALWSREFDGLPPNDFFQSLDPLLDGYRSRLFNETYTADHAAGRLSTEWTNKLGLSADTLVGVGAFDAHMGAVGGQIEPYYLSKVMGTSTCDMLVAPGNEIGDKLIEGICGQVPGSVIPGMLGMEAGQSAFGDVYAWFKQLLNWPIEYFITDPELKQHINDQMIRVLNEEASRLPVSIDDELAVDWLNGRRTPDANQELKAAVIDLDLATDAPAFFKSLVEATCFGAKAIVERFVEQGVPVKGLIGLGGVAKKSPYIMQTMANVMNMPIRIHRSEQTCAAGAAMFAAVVAKVYPDINLAMQQMGQGFDATYHPDPSMTKIYAERYKRYKALGKYIESLDHES